MANKKASEKATKATPAAAENASDDSSETKARKNPSVKKSTEAALAIYDIVKDNSDATLRDIKPKKSDANIYEDNLSDEELLARTKQLRQAREAAKKYDGLSDNQLRNILSLVKTHLGITEEAKD